MPLYFEFLVSKNHCLLHQDFHVPVLHHLEAKSFSICHIPRLTCQDGIQLCYHVLCVVQAETHGGLELQDIPPGAIGAQQNVVFFQPARIGQGHSRACCLPAKGTSHGPFRPSSAWLWPRGRDSSHTALRTFHRPVPTRIQPWPPPAKLLPNIMAQHQRPLSGVPCIWP